MSPRPRRCEETIRDVRRKIDAPTIKLSNTPSVAEIAVNAGPNINQER